MPLNWKEKEVIAIKFLISLSFMSTSVIKTVLTKYSFHLLFHQIQILFVITQANVSTLHAVQFVTEL
jgi:hypothetical protein